jgi:hypothetical protein
VKAAEAAKCGQFAKVLSGDKLRILAASWDAIGMILAEAGGNRTHRCKLSLAAGRL